MKDATVIDNDEYVKNPCQNCEHDCPRLCDCEVCLKGCQPCKNLNDLLDVDF